MRRDSFSGAVWGEGWPWGQKARANLQRRFTAVEIHRTAAIHTMPPKYDYHILQAALEGLETQRTRLDEQIQRVRDMLATMDPPADCPTPLILPPRKPRLTPEGRQAIADAQRRRWEAEREAKMTTKTTVKKRR